MWTECEQSWWAPRLPGPPGAAGAAHIAKPPERNWRLSGESLLTRTQGDADVNKPLNWRLIRRSRRPLSPQFLSHLFTKLCLSFTLRGPCAGWYFERFPQSRRLQFRQFVLMQSCSESRWVWWSFLESRDEHGWRTFIQSSTLQTDDNLERPSPSRLKVEMKRKTQTAGNVEVCFRWLVDVQTHFRTKLTPVNFPFRHSKSLTLRLVQSWRWSQKMSLNVNESHKKCLQPSSCLLSPAVFNQSLVISRQHRWVNKFS